MDIPSMLAIQSYAPKGGTKIALESKHSQAISPQNSELATRETEALSSQNVEQAIKVIEETQQLSERQREKVVEQMNEFISSMKKGLSFRIDEQTGRDVVTIFEESTGDIIRQIPDEEMLEVLRRLREQTARYSSGLLIDKV